MREVLLLAYAGAEWVEQSLGLFDDKIEQWLTRNILVEIREIDANPTHNLVLGVEKESLPLAFSVELGAYINALRSSLDVLAVALNSRHNAAREKEVFFPVAIDEKTFLSGGYKGAEFVNGLPDRERTIIESLKPYYGGNADLSALHKLDITRKHRRLLAAEPKDELFRIRTSGNFIPIRGEVGANGETAFGLLAKNAHQSTIELKYYLAIEEPELGHRKPVLPTLRRFIEMVREIVLRFDVA